MSITREEFDVVRTGTRLALVLKPTPLARARGGSDVVQWFLDYYWIRHPISDAAMAAYRAELNALDRWLCASRNTTLLDATEQDLRAVFDADKCPQTPEPRDMPSLSCIKRFYFYLVEVGLRGDDPTEHLYVRTPRFIRHVLAVIQAKRELELPANPQ